MGSKKAVREALKAERMIVTKAYKDGNKKFKKIPKNIVSIGILKYL